MDESREPRRRSNTRSFPQKYSLADQAARLSKWLTQDGRFVSGNRELLDQFCARVTFARFEPRRLATSIPQRLSFENRVMRASDTLLAWGQLG